MRLNKTLHIKDYMLILVMLLLLYGCGRIPDGDYAASVSLTGGSGKAYIQSPCSISVEGGKAVADIIWSSSNYDYMIVGGKTYYPISTDDGSKFRIPVTLNKEMKVQADTTAMGTPHLIDYTLVFSFGDEENAPEEEGEISGATSDMSPVDISGFTYISTDDSSFAKEFKIHRYDKDLLVIAVSDGRNYVVVPDGLDAPDIEAPDTFVIKKPLTSIYLAASAVMCQFDSIGAMDKVTLSGTKQEDWYIDAAKDAMEAGTLVYGGKYSAPDYEMMMEKGTDLAIENTMILHTPKVLEKLEKLGITAFIDRSSYEEDPLGRLEWIKVYGVLCDKEEAAKDAFLEQTKLVEDIDLSGIEGKSVAVFAVNSGHQIVTKKKNDYFVKMIETAGGTYASPDTGSDEKSASSVTVSIEAFYDYAKDADILIYNGTIQDAPADLKTLADMDVTFKDFKAVQSGDVWACDKSLYQFTNKAGTIISDLYEVIAEGKETTEFFYKLK
ncbi:ABC transporter substrate-binding protein [Butyrivibrio sp. VCB2001]|uniref:ABC transporter substrate-binding protein n=1 Tax=Butyrivibrio sp. VCB2001 TaxID=1280667 RepID=UPI0006885399|nr:ABC transporter substrate-binding protein [Butyrivibrio sp. VCB2001]